MWDKEKINSFTEISSELAQILEEFLSFLRSQKETVTEYEASQHILDMFKKHNLKTDHYPPIVAFRENTSFVHYFPEEKSKRLVKESLILIDIWATRKGSKSPFADITWMAYYGDSISKEIKETFDHVIKARDLILDFIKERVKVDDLPTGHRADKIARDYFAKYNLDRNFLHGTGHSIGFNSPHGKQSNLKRSNRSKLRDNLGYTIEPGLYFDGRFGVRSEIDFYISNGKIIVTTPIQKEITIL